MEKSDLQRFRNECVAAHNFYRAAHGTPPICWSTRLAESAQSWAEQLASTTGSLRYSTAKDVGENLTCLWGSELNGQKITRIWYEEGQHFDYNKPRVSSRTRSFCQVVWEGTRELGAGAAVTKYGKQIVVARYFPPMNKKDVARNVKKARSTSDNEQPLAFDTRWSSLYVGLKEFHEECLSVHNEYRIRHGAVPLHWSAELAWEAQQWAENLARTGELRHNDDDTVGENLAGMVGAELSGREAVDIWYEEIESYDFENHGYSEDTSNFTQVVWVASENLGVGRAFDGDLCVVVAFYEPPGNMEGSFGDNVLRMGSTVRERKSKEPKGFIPPTPDLEGFRLECLVTHNYFRARHGSPPLVLSSALTDEAQYWAERLLVTGASEGLDNSRIGISVAVLESEHVSGIKVSELWYKQILSYNFNSPGFSTETLDFSQLVWQSSRKLGVGKATGAEGVTVVVVRYEPVGNIDGLFVQNVRRRGHERGSSEPMIFHVEYKYRIRADSKSTNSFLSWEHDEAPTLELEGDVTKSRADEQESASSLTVTDAFTRLVWIDPNSPTLQRKGVVEERTRGDVDYDDADDEEDEDRDEMEADKHGKEEEQDEEDARTAYEQDYTAETKDLSCVSEEPLAELEEADLFSDPEDDLYQHICEVRRSLSLDSEGTETEMHKGNVLNKVAFFETFQQSFETQSLSNSESSFRRSLIQDELEELASRPKKQAAHEEDEQVKVEQEEEEEEEEHECQLEFDDIFLAHREEDEAEAHVDEDMYEEGCEEDDESLVSVSDTEEVLDFTDCDTRPEDVQDYEFEDNYCVTHEFIEEEPSTLEIFDFSDEEASHQYADLTDPADQPRSSTKRVLASMSLGTATEFHENEPFKLCKDEPPDLMEDAADNYSDEKFQTSEAIVEVPETSFTRTLDPDHCFVKTKQDDVDTRMKELISKIGLLPIEDNKEDRNEVSDFNETIEGKLLENVVSGRKDHEIQDKRKPIEETCEAFIKDNVESEIDFDELFARLERDSTESEGGDATPQTSTEIERSESPDTIHVVLRDHESERSAGMERISGDIELQSSEQLSEGELERERELTPDITLNYECSKSMPDDGIEPVAETIESVERDHQPENLDLEELDARMDGPTQIKTSRVEIIEDRNEVTSEEECCEAVLRDHDEERSRVFEEIGLVPISPDITSSVDEPVEPLPYDQAPKLPVNELPEVTEHIDANVRRDVRCEIDFEELFREIDKVEDDQFTTERADIQRFDADLDTTETSREEECYEAVFRDHAQERSRVFEEIGLVPVSPDITHSVDEPVEALAYDHAPKSTVSELSEITELIDAEFRRDVRCEINLEELFRAIDEVEDGQSSKEMADQHFDAIQDSIETSKEEECCEAVLRDYDQERDRDLQERDLELVSVSPDVTDSFSESVEPLPYDQAPKSSPESQLPEVSEVVNAKVRQDVRSEKNFEEMFLRLEEHVDETAETQRLEETEAATIEETSRASLYVEEETMVDDVVHCASSTSAHISHETKNDMPVEEIVEVKPAVECNRPPSPYKEEITFVEEVTAEIASSPKHVAGEGVNFERIEVVNEVKEGKEEDQASMIVDEHEVVTEVHTESLSSQHVAGEAENIEPFEEVEDETVNGHDNRASLYMEEDHVIQNVAPEVFSSPRHIANECENINLPEEAEEIEEREEEKRASLYMDENAVVDSVTTKEASSYPLHIAGETQNVDPQTQREEVEPSEDEKRASMYSEEAISVVQVNCDTPLSPKHIACESVNTELVEKVESEELIEQENRASLYVEDEVVVDEVISDAPSSPKHIASESANTEFIEEVGEQIEDEKRASLFIEEEITVNYVTKIIPSSPLHIACESANRESVEEMYEEEFGEVEKRASLFLEEDSLVNEIVSDTPSSPKYIAGESQHVEAFEEIVEEPNEERKRASLFLEETAVLDDVTSDAPSSPKHVAAESRNVELFEEIQEEPTEESKRASLFLEEAPNVEEVTTDFPSSPKHISDIIRNVETFEEIEEEPTEDSKRASLFLEEAVTVDDVTTDTPSSPKHLAGESVNGETFEDVAVVPEDENKRASVFLEEDITYGYVSLEDSDQNHHVAGEISNSGLLEVTDDEDSPESDYGEHFQEFEGTYGTETFVEPPNVTHIAGEIRNIDSHDQAVEEVLQLEESLEYEDRPQMVTTTDLLEITQPSFHIAGELSNVEPREESSEEEKPEEEASAEEIEETQVQASTVVLKSPQSLLSIAAAVLEQNIDAAQQDVSEECTTETDTAQQYSEEENADVKLIVSEALASNACVAHEREGLKQHEETVEVTVILEHSPIIYEDTETTDVSVADDTNLPAILVNIAGELSDNEEDNVVFVEDEHKEVHEIETERYEDQEETAIAYTTEEQQVQSHVTAEFCVSEFVLNEGEIKEQTDLVEPFEESEEGSVSELLSECSSSPLHVSSELKDFQDYETISEEYGTETYHAITYEEGDFVSEKAISKGLPSLFITEELTPHEIYQENKLNEQSMVLETNKEYNEVEEPFQIQTSVVISQSPLQTTAELSASDYNDSVEEEDELSEREFMEEFVDTDILKESTAVVSKVVSMSDPQLAEGEDDLLDETDNAQKFEVQETLVNLKQPARDTSLAILTSEDERVVHKEEKVLEEVWEMEVKKGSQYVETFEEKHEASQIQKFTVVSEKEERSVEMKSSYQVLESKESYSVSQTHRGESVLVGEQGTHIELAHEMEEKVEVFSTRTMHHHVSSTTSTSASTSANEFTSMGTQYQLETNGACISREEVRNIQEVSFTAIQQTSQQRSWTKEEERRPVESSDQLSESILDKEAKDHELEKFEKQLTEEETEVRLMKSEVMEYKTAERQAPLVSPRVTVERETTFVKALVVQSGTKEEQEQVLMREDRVTAILKDDEASLEEESAGEQFEEEIDIMRIDEALSEEEFRGEGDRIQSRSSKADSTEELNKSEEQDEDEVKIREVESSYEEEFEVQRVQGQVEEASNESEDNMVETPAFEVVVEVTAFKGSDDPVKESLEPAEEIEVRAQQPVFEEELEVSAFPKEDSPVHDDYAEEDRQVDRSAVFEEELEVSAVATEHEPVEEQNKPVDYSAVFEEELEVAHFEKQNIEEEIPGDPAAVFEEELEVSALTSHEPVEEQHTNDEEREAVLVESEENKRTDDKKSLEQTDEEHIETTRTSTQKQPLDLSQVDLYDDEEGASATRYYVELSSTESLETAYEEVEDETCYTETYVRQGDPLEENLEEFILVRYGDEFESSGEEDISDHREIYVIPEEENDVENHVAKAARDDNVKAEEPKPETFFEEGFENMGLEEIRESPEFDIDSDSDELDEEEQRQLEEYERLESFVILEEKLSQVESDDDEIADLQGEEGDENVFHSDVHSSSEETLHEDELAETMIASSIREAAASTETTCKEDVSQGDDCSQAQEHGNDEQNEPPVECSSSREELTKDHEGFTGSKVAEEVTLGEGIDNKATPKEDAGDESLSEGPADTKEDSEFSGKKDEKTEQHLSSSDSSGEQSMSSEGSLSSTPSVDLEGLDNFEQDCLLQHNLYRRQHRVKPLKWSEELAEGAKRWAEHLASVNSLESFEGKEVGENLTSMQGKELNGTEVADMWYKEVTDYNFEDPAFNAKCGRFTQVVWASSREFGVARFLTDDGTQYVVARYKPAGNIVGDFKENVKPPKERLKRRRSSARRRSKSGTPSTPAEREKFKTECVISHNYYRTFHNAPALRWSPLLAAEAQNYAERLAKTDSLTHSGQKDRGENLAYTWDSPLSARGAIDMWYDEVQDYEFENPGFTSDTGHFTQLVWVGTEEFGMGMAVAPDGRNIVVGRYVPPGNVVGQFKENVRPRGIDGFP